jgi:glycosyltransferase involved in cell wall biosynthesis
MTKLIFVPFTIKEQSYDIVSRIIQSLVEFSTEDIDFILFTNGDIKLKRKVYLLKQTANNPLVVWWQMWLTFIKNILAIDGYFYVIDDPKTLFFWLTARIFNPKIQFVVRVGGSYEVRFKLVDKISFWGNFYTHSIQKLVIRLNLKIASKIIFVSHYCQDNFQKYFVIPKSKCATIYNGVSITKPRQSTVRLEKKHRFKGVVIFNGRLVKQKRPGIVFELSKRMKNVLFIMITTGLRASHVPRRDNIYYYNEINFDQVIQLYQLADLYLAPSLMEGCSNALLEAMASGLPVIASRSGTLPELVEDNENGFLVDVNKTESQSFQEKIDLIFNKPQLKRKMAQASLDKARSLNWQQVAKQYESVFTS